MTSDDNNRVVTFTGRVIARQDDLIITCDQMRVHYQPISGKSDSQASQPGEPGQTAPEATLATNGSQGQSVAPPLSPPSSQALAKVAANDNAKGGQGPNGRDNVPGPLESGQEIYRVECEGSVKIQQRDRLGVGQKALYLAKSEPRRLILTGDARVWEAGNSVTGHQVIYYLDQNRSQIESRQNQRVRAFYGNDGQE
ncbi:MAG: hypothetical protein LBU69_06440 [Deltaproteobacteria bacterium]|jgi:lipopolysaccharide export system protein LptA|nr:hypothetical protein [Deltaproteobacteria bacterium]